MAGFGSFSVEDVNELKRRFDPLLKSCGSFQEAAQRFVDVLYEELSDSAVLFRAFATVPYAALPEKEKAFALAAARERGSAGELQDKTTVVTLLATRGRRPAWNDRYRSEGRLALPLTSASFIKTIPMVSRLMSDMGTGIGWVEKQKTNIVVSSMGRMARVLYVEDARAELTSDGFKVVPDQKFVVENGVRSVIGLGGAYLNRAIVVMLLFTNEVVPRDRVEKLMPLVHGFKVATMKLVMDGELFP
jgi:hypothetical protein